MENTQNKQPSIPCPECDNPLEIPQEIVLGKIIECPACGTENEVVKLVPIQLAPLEEEK